ncbi:hypothetical protein [Palleronia sp. THAF1]|uniref:hypothetical protein n=1 Tax=Palleronia sp. THAF1 TaxID=2587842 RepID=UPI001267D14B|nr:hypothetical protein [Palleronia sp. THAF1]
MGYAFGLLSFIAFVYFEWQRAGFIVEAQGYIVALATLAAAIVTISSIEKQIEQKDQLREDERIRNLNAALAEASISASTLYEHATKCALKIISLDERIELDWEIADKAAIQIAQITRTGDEKQISAAKRTVNLYQITRARYSGLLEDIKNVEEVNSSIVEYNDLIQPRHEIIFTFAEMQKSLTPIFEFARGDSVKIKTLNKDEILSFLRINFISEIPYGVLHDLEERAARWQPAPAVKDRLASRQ